MTVRYLHIADDLRRQIVTGVILAGSQLPSEEQLAAAYRVGKPTLRRALGVLEDEGFVEKFHGRGNFVRQPFQRTIYPGGLQPPDGQAVGTATRVDVDVAEVAADSHLSALLQVPVNTPLIEYAHLCIAAEEGRRHSWARVYLPRELSVTPPAANLSPWGDDVRELLAAAGIQLAGTTERITARFPETEEMRALQVTAWTSVLAIERTSVDVDGRVVEATLLALPGDRAEARYITRTPSSAEASR